MEEELLCSSSSSNDVVPRETKTCSTTPTVIFTTLIASCGSLAFGFAGGYSSPAESGIMSDLGLSVEEYSLFASFLKFGGMLGALMSGGLADFFGRRIALWILDIFFILGWIAIIFGKKASWLDMGRLLTGIGSGIYCYVTPIYLAEITPKDIRGGFTAITTFALTCGFSLMYFVGNYITWRALALIGVLPSVVHALGVFFIPESPRWLAKIGNDSGLETALRRLRGRSADISMEATEIKEYVETMKQESKSRFWDLFDRRYAHPLLVVLGLILMVQFGGSDGIASYAYSIFESAGKFCGCDPAAASTAMAVIQIPFAGASVLLMDKAGRRRLLMVTAAISCCACFLVGLGFLFKALNQSKNLYSLLVLIGLLINSASYAAGMCGTPWVVLSEVLPLNIKGTGGSLVTTGNWLSSWIITYSFNYVFDWSSFAVFFFFSIVYASLFLFVTKFIHETKGQTLEEIQASMEMAKE